MLAPAVIYSNSSSSSSSSSSIPVAPMWSMGHP
jgi:hypothetical protein